MSELEKAGQRVLAPLFRGESRSLSPVGQETVAVWAIKTALVCEFMDPQSASAPASHFDHIFRTLTPPPGTNVWLASYGGQKELDYNHRRLHFSWEDRRVRNKTGYLTAFIIGRLVIYVMGLEAEEPWITNLSDHARRAVIPIQPREHVYPRWPPPVILGTDDGVESFLLAIAPTREPEDAA